MMVHTYDPIDVNVIVDGTILTGFAEGAFVQVEQEEESYTSYVGAKGEVTRSKNANKMGRITVTLKQSSPSNALLSRLAKSRHTFPVSVVDQNFRATAGGTECWVEKPANMEFGKEAGEREWIFIVSELEINE
jgi:hypothetical protein